jgi:K+/H+ antiporter YhaU regulatory subunit KhtT
MNQQDDETDDNNNNNDTNEYQIVGLDKEDLAIILHALEHYRDSLNIALSDKQIEETELTRPTEKTNRITEMLNEMTTSTNVLRTINLKSKKQEEDKNKSD